MQVAWPPVPGTPGGDTSVSSHVAVEEEDQAEGSSGGRLAGKGQARKRVMARVCCVVWQ